MDGIVLQFFIEDGISLSHNWWDCLSTYLSFIKHGKFSSVHSQWFGLLAKKTLLVNTSCSSNQLDTWIYSISLLFSFSVERNYLNKTPVTLPYQIRFLQFSHFNTNVLWIHRSWRKRVFQRKHICDTSIWYSFPSVFKFHHLRVLIESYIDWFT